MNTKKDLYIVLITIILLFLYPLIVDFDEYYLYVMTIALIWAGLALAWNILGGFTGQVSFGHAAFFGTGAYITALVSVKLGVTPLISILIAMFATGLFSLAIGAVTLRLRTHYFALSMLAVSEIAFLIVLNWREVTGGSMGVYGIPAYTSYFSRSRLPNYYLILILILMIGFTSYKIVNSKLGLAFKAIRDDEDAALSRGIHTFKYKLIALLISAMFTGFLGAIYAHYIYYVDPETVFSADYTVFPIVMSLFGSMNSVVGPMIGGVFLWLIDSLFLSNIFPVTHPFFYGIILLITIIYLPEGVLEYTRRKLRERSLI